MLCSLLYYTLILLLCRFGGVAQLGERLLCKQEVIGSNPFTSTNSSFEIDCFRSYPLKVLSLPTIFVGSGSYTS